MKKSWKCYFRRILAVTVVGGATMLASAAQYAWAVASDNAGNAPYADGWTYGDNGGTGFGLWDPGYSGGSYVIDNGPVAGSALGAPAWHMHSDGYGTVDLNRPFSTPLAAGQIFSIDVAPPTSLASSAYSQDIYLRLRSSSGIETSIVFANTPTAPPAGPLRILISDGTGSSFDTGIDDAISRAGMNVAFTSTGLGTYDIVISDLGGAPLFSDSRNLFSSSPLDSVNFSVGFGVLYANNMSIVPEPATGALLLVSASGLLLGRIRVKRS